MSDNMELFKQFQDNPSFKKWLTDMVFNLTYNKEGKPYEAPNNVPQVSKDKPTEDGHFQEPMKQNRMIAENEGSYGKR